MISERKQKKLDKQLCDTIVLGAKLFWKKDRSLDEETMLLHIKNLIKKGANINSLVLYQKERKTPLMVAIKNYRTVSFIKNLIELGASPTVPDLIGRNSLFTVAERENKNLYETKELIDLLLKNGANINSQDDFKCTVLHTACENGELFVTSALLELGANPTFIDNSGNNCLMRAIIMKNRPFTYCYYNQDQIDQKLNSPIYKRYCAIIEMLCKHVDINEKNATLKSPLQLEVLYGHDLSMVDLLLKNGAVIDFDTDCAADYSICKYLEHVSERKNKIKKEHPKKVSTSKTKSTKKKKQDNERQL